MKIRHRMIVFDAADIHAESAFWAGLLGGTVEAGDRWHNIWVDGGWQLGVQLAPDHVPPDWPDGRPQQIHLDFYVDDFDAAHEQVISRRPTIAPRPVESRSTLIPLAIRSACAGCPHRHNRRLPEWEG